MLAKTVWGTKNVRSGSVLFWVSILGLLHEVSCDVLLDEQRLKCAAVLHSQVFRLPQDRLSRRRDERLRLRQRADRLARPVDDLLARRIEFGFLRFQIFLPSGQLDELRLRRGSFGRFDLGDERLELFRERLEAFLDAAFGRFEDAQVFQRQIHRGLVAQRQQQPIVLEFAAGSREIAVNLTEKDKIVPLRRGGGRRILRAVERDPLQAGEERPDDIEFLALDRGPDPRFQRHAIVRHRRER
jgi:hypothetical protein